MGKPGRIPKLTPELTKRFCEAIANGMSRNRAADLVGIHRITVARWMRLGRSGKGGKLAADCVNFVTQIALSEARFIEKNLKSVERAATPKLVKVRKTITRPLFDAAGNRIGETVTVEETAKKEHDWSAARWLLECKDRESFGPDRHEIAALKKDIADLRKLLAESVARLSGGGDGEQAENRAGAVSGGGNSGGGVSTVVDSGSAGGSSNSGGAG